ncbi:hypothetical protein D3C75_994630 [compost metagenome]
MSNSSNSLTVLRRSGRIWMFSRPASLAVWSMVPSMSSSSAAPWRANLRRRRRATLMLRVPSSTESSRFLYSRWSQTLAALPWRLPASPTRMPSGLKPPEPNGLVPPVPIHLLPPA